MSIENLAEAMAYIVGQLRAGGLQAVLDPADADLPGVIVYPNLIDFDRLDEDDYELTVDLVLVARGVRQADALGQLAPMVDKVRAVFPVAEVRAVLASLPSQGPDPFPALQTSVTVTVTTTESELGE